MPNKFHVGEKVWHRLDGKWQQVTLEEPPEDNPGIYCWTDEKGEPCSAVEGVLFTKAEKILFDFYCLSTEVENYFRRKTNG